MDTRTRKVILICAIGMLLLGLLALFFFETEREEQIDDNPAVPTEAADTSTPIPTRVIVLNDNQGDDSQKTELVMLRYYTVSSMNIPNKSAEVVIEAGQEVTPSLVMDYFLESLEDEEIVLDINKIDVRENVCNVDFGPSIKKLAEDSAITEVHILDAVAMGILDNCEGISDITFTIDGGRYKTENVILNEGEVYLSD